MYLNQTIEYGMRAMAQLALEPEGEFVRVSELSTKTGIPQHYLSKVLRRLVQDELLAARKGHGGGFKLARSADQTRFRDILVALGFDPSAKNCLFGWPHCGPKDPCPLHHVCSGLNESFRTWAEETTLADIRR